MYTDKATIQNYLLVNIDSSFDTQIDEWILAVQNWIETYTGRKFIQETATTKLYDGDGSIELIVNDIITISKFEILDEDGNVEATFDDVLFYYLDPPNDIPKTRIVINKFNAPLPYFPKGKQNIKVTGTFGYAAAVPAEIKLAATQLVAGIIMDGNYDVGKEIQSERLGEYSITYQAISEQADRLGVKDILDRYRNIPI